MKVFRLLLCLPLALLCTVAAKADDFRTHILDPPSLASSYPTFPITTNPFAVDFTACQTNELPGNNTADGCFAGINRTGVDWTSVSIIFPNTVSLASQPVSCAPAPTDNIFSQTRCALTQNNTTYDLIFTSGLIANGDPFFITEEGVDPTLFPQGTVSYTSSAVTPEPTSLLLLSTGMASLAALRRRLQRP